MAHREPSPGDGQFPEAGPGRAGQSGYLPVSEHGLIGDLHCVALVGTNGTIDWHCCPSFDSPSIFGSLLDKDRGGYFQLARAVPAKSSQFYLPDTNVLITRFSTDGGVGEVQDFMPIPAADDQQRHRVIRRVLCARGRMPMRARIAPRFDHGTDTHTITDTQAGAVFRGTSLTVGLTATVPVERDDRDVTAQFGLSEGQSAVFALDEVSGDAVPRSCSVEEVRELGEATISFWRTWLSAFTSTTTGTSPSPAPSGTRSLPVPTGSAITGTSPTRESGRPAAAPRSSCTRS